MENILYLDDYINIYTKKLNKILTINPYKNTLRNGRIIDRVKFIKKLSKVIKENKLNNNLFNNNIMVIISSLITIEDKKIIEESLEELNYKNIKFISEIKYLKLNKNRIYINCAYSFIYFYYINYLGDTEVALYDYKNINSEIIMSIIKQINKKEIYLYGKNYLEIAKKLDLLKIDYYFFEDSENLLIKLLV